MREIKFRGWDSELKVMVYSNELCGGVNYDCNPVRALNIILNEDDHGFEYMQLTGLKDKYGAEIWEGDILKREFEIGNTTYDPITLGVDGYEIADSGYFIGVVRYRPSEGFVLGKVLKYNDDGELVEKKSSVKIYAKYTEIIGNRFENPELLEVAE